MKVNRMNLNERVEIAHLTVFDQDRRDDVVWVTYSTQSGDIPVV